MENPREGLASPALASIARASIDRTIMSIFDPIRGTRGLGTTTPAVNPTGTAIIAERITTTGPRIITTGRESTMFKFFRRPCCCHPCRRCRHFSGRMINPGFETIR